MVAASQHRRGAELEHGGVGSDEPEACQADVRNKEQVEAGMAFGCTSRQLLLKVQMPLALPSIMAGVNQTIMLALSMVVIASMIGAGGLGNTVLTGIQRLNVGLGFEGGLGVVILAILLDRISQSFAPQRRAGR